MCGGGWLNVARDVQMRITAAMSRCVECMRVQTGVDVRHLLEHECERIMGWGEGALLRAMAINVI
jgi:hypothetical protein